MIRMIVAVLVVINVVLYLWTQQQYAQEQSNLPVAGGDLKLLSEAKLPEPLLVPPKEEMPEQPKPKPAEVKPSPVAQKPQPNSEATPAKPRVVKTEKKEPPQSQQPPEKIGEIQKPTPAQKFPEATCYTYGPINDRQAAAGIVKWLQGLTTKPKIRLARVQQIQGYRVLIEGAKTEQEAVEKEQQLKAAGITDVWRITRGKKRGAISMGAYSLKANAVKRAAQAESKGFKASIEAKKLIKDRYWVDFSSPKFSLSPKDLGLVPGAGQTVKYRPCETANK